MLEFQNNNTILTDSPSVKRSIKDHILVMILTAFCIQSLFIALYEYSNTIFANIASGVDYSIYCKIYYSPDNATQYYILIDFIIMEVSVLFAAIYYGGHFLVFNGISRRNAAIIILTIYTIALIVSVIFFEVFMVEAHWRQNMYYNDGAYAGIASVDGFRRVGEFPPLIVGVTMLLVAYLVMRLRRVTDTKTVARDSSETKTG